jgi:sugar phosphate isomerase/epimerase
LDIEKLSQNYCDQVKKTLASFGLELFAISNHTVGQCVCDRIDKRHQTILPARIWGDGEAEGVRQRATEEMIKVGTAAKMLGVDTVIGFTGSPIWHLLYSFPPVTPDELKAGFKEVADRFKPILDSYHRNGIRFALEVHPTEIAFDISSAQTLLEALDYHPAFGFNYDPSHFGYQGVDYVAFIEQFADRIFHVHMKDVWWSDVPTRAGVFGGHLPFGHRDRFWDFRSIGRGKIDFEAIIRMLNRIDYQGALSVEWEDNGMDREHGAAESLQCVKKMDFRPSNVAFDAAFERK